MEMNTAHVPCKRERTGGAFGSLALPVYSSQVRRSARKLSHNFISKPSNRFETGTDHSGIITSHRSRVSSMTTVPQLGGGGVWLLQSSPLLLVFPEINHVRHSAPPVRLVTETNMEKSVNEVCKLKSCAISASDIQEARDIHQRLVVRMMTSPGDSKGAMYRIEAAYGLSYHCQVNLRHQNRASGEFIARLHSVWLSVLEASVKREVAELLAAQGEME